MGHSNGVHGLKLLSRRHPTCALQVSASFAPVARPTFSSRASAFKGNKVAAKVVRNAARRHAVAAQAKVSFLCIPLCFSLLSAFVVSGRVNTLLLPLRTLQS